MGQNRNFENIIYQVQDFFGQQVYSSLGSSIAQKKKYLRVLFFFIHKISRTKPGNFLIIITISLFYLKIWKPKTGCRIFQYAPSQNNIRALARFNKILLSAGITDISLNGDPLSFFHRLRILIKSKDIRCAVQMLTQHRHNNPFIHVQQVIGCAALLICPAILNKNFFKILCVANDHLPTCMALLIIAKKMGIATCYVQHAPVTEYFPPLNYDLSVLFDRASHIAYQKAAVRCAVPEKGKVLFLPLFEEGFCHPTVGISPYIIGVCLSFLPNIKGLQQLLTALSQNDRVSKILLRRHPRCRQDLSVLLAINKVYVRPTGEAVADFFKSIDITLVPNSGVAIESLHSGKVTFYTQGVDMLANDYYGFIDQGIIPVFNMDFLNNRHNLQSFFDPEWKKRFSMYDETITSSLKELERNIVRDLKLFLAASD